MPMNANELINQLGGTTKVANLLGIKPPSVSEWRALNKIPRESLIFLAPIAEKIGVISRQELLPLDYWRVWPELPPPKVEMLPIPESCKAVLPFLKSCGRLKDDLAIAQFLSLPPEGRRALFNGTPYSECITAEMCLELKQRLAREC